MTPSPFPPRPTTRRKNALRRSLSQWFEVHARELPWRQDSDSYRVWVSEAMLQQTRVEAVLGYYGRFLEAFPTVEALAAAEDEELLAAWSGLGYYRRARFLRSAAQVVVEQHGGSFPRTRKEALALPGVGEYTAGAVLSIAHDLPEALVDGNVARVFCRLFALDGEPESAVLKNELWALARELVPRRDPGTWNQALMELGALVCTPRNPSCDQCPWRGQCAAQAEGRVAELPRPKVRPAPIQVELELAVVERRGSYLLERRPAGGRMAGLWQFPTRELVADGAQPRLFPAHFHWELGSASTLLPSERGQTASLGELTHSITKHRIRGRLIDVRGPRSVHEPSVLVPEAEIAGLALTGMAKKVLARISAE